MEKNRSDIKIGISLGKNIIKEALKVLERENLKLPPPKNEKKKRKIFLAESSEEIDVKNDEITVVFAPRNSILRASFENLKSKKSLQNIFLLEGEKNKNKEGIKNLLLKSPGVYFLSRRWALFPFQKIDNVIILDYHEKDLFLEDRNPKISYFSLAFLLAKSFGANVFLVSKTPFLKDFLKYEKIGKFEKKKPFSEVEILKKGAGLFWLSKRVADEVKNALKEKKSVAFFWEKRGFAESFFCKSCGFDFLCEKCKKPLSIKAEKIVCEHCKKTYNKESFDLCPNCKGKEFFYLGKGVEFLKKEIARELEIPESKVFFFSSDLKKSQKREILRKAKREPTVLITTSSILDEEIDFRFGVFVVLRADFLFFAEDELSDERFFQKIYALSCFSRKTSEKSIFQVEKESKILNFALTRNLKSFFKEKLQRESENETQSQTQKV